VSWCKVVENRVEIDRWFVFSHSVNMCERTLSYSPSTADSLCNLARERSDSFQPPPKSPTGPVDQEPKPRRATLRSAGQYDCENSGIIEQIFELDDLIPCKVEVAQTLSRSTSGLGENPVNPLQ
jgi:hypothetical protein